MSVDPRPNARGGRAARRANKRELEQDRLESRGVIMPLDEAKERAWAEKLNCPICRAAVHPTNWSDHMKRNHPEKVIPLHEAEPGRLPLTAIRLDGGTQPRGYINGSVVQDYTDEMKEGRIFPPIVAFYDGSAYWLADGFHRVDAAKRAGLTDVAADVRQGTQRDAILFSVGANGSHGLRRTNDDKHRAVSRLLNDEEWTQWSDREIARRCAVSDRFVNNIRKGLTANGSQLARTYTTKHGTTATMNTGNIGKSEPVTYGRVEDDYQPEVPEVQVGEEKTAEYYARKLNETPWRSDTPEGQSEEALGGRGATVKAASGQIGKLLWVSGRIAIVDTVNGRRPYDVDKLERVEAEAPAAQEADEPEPAVTPSYVDLPERQVEFLVDLANNRPVVKNAATRMALRGHALITQEDEWATIRLTAQGELWLGVRNLLPKSFNYKRDNQTTRTANELVAQPFDLCQTPAYALDPLLPYLGWSMPSTVWEPAAGEGLLVEGLYDGGWTEAHVIQSDIQSGQNFFDYEPDEWDIIVTNPPYSLKLDWLERCYALGKPFALLLPVDVIGTKTAQALMQAHGFELMLLSDRVDFKMPHKGWDGAGAQFSVLWLCWNLLPEKIMFGDIEAGKKAFKGGLADDNPE